MHGRRIATWAALAAALLLHVSASWWMVDAMSLLDPRSTAMARMQASFTRSIEARDVPAATQAVTTQPAAPAPAAARSAEEAASSARARREAARQRELARAARLAAAQAGASSPADTDRAAQAVSAVVPELVAAASLPDLPAAAGSAPAATPVAPEASASEAVALPPAAGASAPSDRATAFQWPASTRIRYRLLGNYRGEVNGSAQVTWLREGDRYQVHLEVFIGPSFAPLVTRRMSSEGIVTATGLSPRRYEQETRQLLSSARLATLRFDAEGITLANGKRVPPLADVQDTASQFIQMIYLFTTRPELREAGRSVEIGLALPNRADRWLYDVGPLVVEQTPMGDLEAFNVRPRRAAAAGDLAVEIWFAPRLEMLPIRFRIRQDADTYVDLFLEQAPQQATP